MRFVNDTQTVAADPSDSGLQLIAAGQWRTATSTLQHVFEQQFAPSLAPSMHGAYIMPSVTRMRLCCAAARENSKVRRQILLRQLFMGYKASSDYPGMAFVDDLLEMYPDAKIVLDKRSSAQAWASSVQDSLAFFASWTYLALTCLVPQSYWHWRIYRDYMLLARRWFGTDSIFTAQFYEMHNEWVRRVANEHGKEVLEWEPNMGLERLGEFAGRDIRPGNDRLPTVNEHEAIKQLTSFLVWRGIRRWAMFLGAGLGLGVAYRSFK